MITKNTKNIIITAAVLVIVGMVGFFAGAGTASKDYVNTLSNMTENSYLQTDPGKIAVVNMDEGIIDNGVKLNYGAQILGYNSNKRTITTGLEDARQGLQDGKYAAYIIIPSTFSESVVSINKTPQKAVLQYKLGERLKGDELKSICFDIISFEKLINDNLGYIYVYSILDEFHSAQDNSKIILKNDKEELELLKGLDFSDLIDIAAIGDFTLPESEMEPIDLSEYSAKNTQAIDDISSYYKEEYNLNTTDMQLLIEDGNSMENHFHDSRDLIDGVDIVAGVQGDSSYTEGVELAETYIANFHESQSENVENLKNVVDNMEANNLDMILEQVQELISEKLEAIRVFLDDVFQAVKDIFDSEFEESLSEDMLEGLLDSPTATDSDGPAATDSDGPAATDSDGPAATDSDGPAATDSDGPVATDSNAPTATDSNAPTATSSNAYQIRAQDIVIDYDQLEADLDQYLSGLSDLGDIDMEKIMDIIQGSSQAGIETSVQSINRLIWQWWREVINWRDDIWRDRIRELNNRWISKVNTIKEIIFQELLRTTVDYPEELKSVHLSTVVDRQEENYILARSYLDALPSIEDGQLVETLEQGVSGALSSHENEVKESLVQEHQERISELKDFLKRMEGFDFSNSLSIDTFDTLIEQLYKNNKEKDALDKKFASDTERYIEAIYKSALDAANEAEKSIQSASQTSGAEIDGRLKNIRNSKEKNKQTNQRVLDHFVSQLSYTRLGSSEYTEVYDFIVNPLSLSEVSQSQDKKDNQTMQGKVQSGAETVGQGYEILYILGIALVILLLTALIHIYSLWKERSRDSIHPTT